MRKFGDLTASDFPGVDPEKFEELRRLGSAWSNRVHLVVLASLFLLLPMIFLGGLWTNVLAALELVFFFGFGVFWSLRALKIFRLMKEMGITKDQTQAALEKDAP